jgi:hypothetical protein
MAHDDDGELGHCQNCGTNLLLRRLKWTILDDIASLEDLLYEVRAGLITNVRLREGVTEDNIYSPCDFEWDTLPGGRS